jgi:hypothetical protein
MNTQRWPDRLQPPDLIRIEHLLSLFWTDLRRLPELVQREEHLLAEQLTAALRATVIEMMLALNGIALPIQTRHLNHYLSANQRAALVKTLTAPAVAGQTWIGRAVALVVIYRWYAPQLLNKYHLEYPDRLEQEVWAELVSALPGWPVTVATPEA